jgi:Mg-chelatase subunit ChlI
VGQDNIVDKLSEMFATSVIGNNYVKKGLLLVAASTCTDKTLKKLHAILVGDPGLAKSRMLKEAVGLVPNSRYESVQFATGKSLTVIVTKEEGDALILRIGPIAQAKGAIAALNELSSMNHEDQKYMLDTMQEQGFTTNKFGQNFYVDAPTAIIASANPIGGSWKSNYDDEAVNLDKIPMIKPLIDRFDLIFVCRDSRDVNILTDYAFKKSEMEDRPTPNYTAYLVKHIMYAKQRYPKPRFSEEAKAMLNQYYVSIRVKYGSPRILETIYRIAQNITRLKLKNIVDAADAKETVQFYNVILQQLDMVVASPANPRDVVYEECLGVLLETKFPISFEEVVKTACQRNRQVERYIGKSFRLEDNKKLRPILDMLRNHSRIKEIQMRPVVLQYVHSDLNDLNDLNDLPTDTHANNLEGENTPEKIAEVSDPRSLRSERSERSEINTPMYTPEGGNGNGNGHGNDSLLKCYWCEKVGNSFQTKIVEVYEKHGTLRHPNKSLYPNMVTIKENGLNPQGREWET